jgi:type VII secretion integral membrane protein EccD
MSISRVPSISNSVSAASAPGVPVSTLVRLTITHNDRRLDVGIPTHTPLMEHLPGFVRHLGALDPSLVHGGYWLQRADGTVLDAERPLLDQGVRDGDLLTLSSGALQPDPQVYDDVVEAVGDAVSRQQAPWTGRDSARTALAASTAFLVIGAVLIATTSHSLFTALVAGAGALLVVAVAAVVSRLGQPVSGLVLGLTATVYGAVCGYLLVPAGDLWGYPIAGAGAGATVVGIVAAASIARYRELAITPMITGFLVAIAGLVVGSTSIEATSVFAVTLAACATLCNGLPYLALSTSRITVVTPHSDQEIFLTPPPIDGQDVAARYALGHRVLLVLRIALALVVLVAVPIVVTDGVSAAVLAALAFAGLMTSARKTYARSEVLAILGTGIGGILLVGVTTAIAHPDWQPALVLVLTIGAAVIVGLTLLSSRTGIRIGRLADLVDVFSLVLLLPLAVLVAGIA